MSRKDKTMDIIKLAKPYVFEGTEYGEIDLSGLDKLTVQDAIDAQLALTGQPGRGDPARREARPTLQDCAPRRRDCPLNFLNCCRWARPARCAVPLPSL